MKELDKLGWTAGLSFVSHGVRIGIRSNEPAVLESLPERLPPDWKPARIPEVDDLYSLFAGGRINKRGGVRSYNLLYWHSARLARSMDMGEVLDTLEHSLHFNVAVKARRRLFVHAGVVGWRGRAIVIPGRSMSGKTELVRALVEAGATYYSDEYAVLDSRGRVHPYAKPLSLRGEDGNRRQCTAESLGGRRGRRPLPVGLVVLTKFEEGARWRPRRLSPGLALLGLLDHTLLARSVPGVALAALRRALMDGAVVLKGKRGEGDATVRLVFDRLDARNPASLLAR